MDPSWSQDVCVHCEQPCSGNWCSEHCRLANLDTSSRASSQAVSPSTPSSTAQSSSPHSRNNGFYLPPALDFPSRGTGSLPSNTKGRWTHSSQHSYFPGPFPGSINSSRFVPPPRALTPSTSRSSLSSVSSNSSQCSSLSDQAQNELRSYSNSFDLIRNWKRRMASN